MKWFRTPFEKLEFQIQEMEKRMSLQMQKLLDAVNAQKTVIAGVQTAFAGLAGQIADLKTHPAIVDDPDAQALIDGIAQTIQANSDQLSQAITSTGNAPTPTAAPVDNPATVTPST